MSAEGIFRGVEGEIVPAVPGREEGDIDLYQHTAVWEIVKERWRGCSKVFPIAFGKKNGKERLLAFPCKFVYKEKPEIFKTKEEALK